MIHAPVPDEQLQRIQPGVEDLLTQLRALADRMPSDTDSALVFQPSPEAPE